MLFPPPLFFPPVCLKVSAHDLESDLLPPDAPEEEAEDFLGASFPGPDSAFGDRPPRPLPTFLPPLGKKLPNGLSLLLSLVNHVDMRRRVESADRSCRANRVNPRAAPMDSKPPACACPIFSALGSNDHALMCRACCAARTVGTFRRRCEMACRCQSRMFASRKRHGHHRRTERNRETLAPSDNQRGRT